VDRIEGLQEFDVQLHNISLNELEGVVRLLLKVHTHDFKSCPMISHRCTTSTAKEVKQLWLPAKALRS
jgi:hypothetical protein